MIPTFSCCSSLPFNAFRPNKIEGQKQKCIYSTRCFKDVGSFFRSINLDNKQFPFPQSLEISIGCLQNLLFRWRCSENQCKKPKLSIFLENKNVLHLVDCFERLKSRTISFHGSFSKFLVYFPTNLCGLDENLKKETFGSWKTEFAMICKVSQSFCFFDPQINLVATLSSAWVQTQVVLLQFLQVCQFCFLRKINSLNPLLSNFEFFVLFLSGVCFEYNASAVPRSQKSLVFSKAKVAKFCLTSALQIFNDAAKSIFLFHFS